MSHANSQQPGVFYERAKAFEAISGLQNTTFYSGQWSREILFRLSRIAGRGFEDDAEFIALRESVEQVTAANKEHLQKVLELQERLEKLTAEDGKAVAA